MEHSVLGLTLHAGQESDQHLLQLLVLRRRLAEQLAREAITPGLSVTLEERVSIVVARLLPQNTGPLDEARLTSLFTTVVTLTEPLFAGISPGNEAPKKG